MLDVCTIHNCIVVAYSAEQMKGHACPLCTMDAQYVDLQGKYERLKEKLRDKAGNSNKHKPSCGCGYCNS